MLVANDLVFLLKKLGRGFVVFEVQDRVFVPRVDHRVHHGLLDVGREALPAVVLALGLDVFALVLRKAALHGGLGVGLAVVHVDVPELLVDFGAVLGEEHLVNDDVVDTLVGLQLLVQENLLDQLVPLGDLIEPLLQLVFVRVGSQKTVEVLLNLQKEVLDQHEFHHIVGQGLHIDAQVVLVQNDLQVRALVEVEVVVFQRLQVHRQKLVRLAVGLEGFYPGFDGFHFWQSGCVLLICIRLAVDACLSFFF